MARDALDALLRRLESSRDDDLVVRSAPPGFRVGRRGRGKLAARIYDVWLGETGDASCSCPDFAKAATEPPATEVQIIAPPETAEPENQGLRVGHSQIDVDAAVLKVGTMSTARIRVLGEDEQITLRSRDVFALAPGLIITLRIEKRWRYLGDATPRAR